jgi:UDPglucose 6-dehydrogenase
MKNIGIVGVGFVGNAVLEGMRHCFSVYSYDKKDEWIRESVGGTALRNVGLVTVKEVADPYEELIKYVDGGPIFVCVPTPMKRKNALLASDTGKCDTGIVELVVKALNSAAQKLKREIVVVVKSTVPPGTCDKLNSECDNAHVCFNPEFLTERSAVEDFKNQDRIIVGGPREGTDVLKQMYEMAYPNVPVTKTSSTIAEMVKYVTNCFLAVKVLFANEIKLISDKLEIDYDKVVEYATKDKRLGTSHWSVPGPDGKVGYGGKCFCKDINALISLALENGVNPELMIASWEHNLKLRPERDWEDIEGVIS